MKRHWRLAAAVAAAAIVSVIAMWWLLRPSTVETVQPSRGPAVSAVYATGIVEPSVQIPIAPRSGGHIVELSADEGDRVQKGQRLARLEDADLSRSVEELEAREAYAERNHQRLAELVRRGMMPVDERDRAEAEWRAARAATARARETLAYMHLQAPADGVVVRRDAEIGAYAAANQPLFYLATEAPLRVAAEVDEEDIPRVAVGQRVLIRADAFPDTLIEGRVDEITPMGDRVSRSYRTRIRLIDPPALMIGMTADTNIIVEQRDDALLLPASAVDESHVWLVRDGHLVRQPVVTGIHGPDRVEILRGLSDDEDVLLRYADGEKPGQSVVPVSAGEP